MAGRRHPGSLTVDLRDGLRHRIRSSIGYATEDCFRGGVGWTDRNLLRTGRLFDISGRVSKVGVGAPPTGSLENSICSGLVDDTIGSSKLNYNVTARSASRASFRRSSLEPSPSSPSAGQSSKFTCGRKSASSAHAAAGRLPPGPHHPRVQALLRTHHRQRGQLLRVLQCLHPQDAQRLSERRVLGILGAGIAWPRSRQSAGSDRGHVYSIESALSSPPHRVGCIRGIPPVYRRRILVQADRSGRGPQLAPPRRNHVCSEGDSR